MIEPPKCCTIVVSSRRIHVELYGLHNTLYVLLCTAAVHWLYDLHDTLFTLCCVVIVNIIGLG